MMVHEGRNDAIDGRGRLRRWLAVGGIFGGGWGGRAACLMTEEEGKGSSIGAMDDDSRDTMDG